MDPYYLNGSAEWVLNSHDIQQVEKVQFCPLKNHMEGLARIDPRFWQGVQGKMT
jgi:hypothetical protein